MYSLMGEGSLHYTYTCVCVCVLHTKEAIVNAPFQLRPNWNTEYAAGFLKILISSRYLNQEWLF